MLTPYIKLHPNDNVMVALRDLEAGTMITAGESAFSLKEAIPAKHKFMTLEMENGSAVTMYGVLVGHTKCTVQQGGLMTTANTGHAASDYGYREVRYSWQPPDASAFRNRTFRGYRQIGRAHV